MMQRLFRSLYLRLSPVKRDDILIGDCIDFGMNSPLEQVLHGLSSKEGRLTHKFWRGPDTYCMTVKTVNLPYYVLECHVLTLSLEENPRFVWMVRNQPRRIDKKKIADMILTGKITRSKV